MFQHQPPPRCRPIHHVITPMCALPALHRLSWRRPILLQHVEVRWISHVVCRGARGHDHCGICNPVDRWQTEARARMGSPHHLGCFVCPCTSHRHGTDGESQLWCQWAEMDPGPADLDRHIYSRTMSDSFPVGFWTRAGPCVQFRGVWKPCVLCRLRWRQ